MSNITTAREALSALKEGIQEEQENREELFARFLEKSRKENAPTIKVFEPSAQASGWWEVHYAFLFTDRSDFHDFCWILSPYHGMCVLDTRITDRDEWLPFEEWDPKADLYVYQYYGGTNMSPREHVKLSD